MPGPLLHLGAVVTCAHAGQATPVTPNPRVQVAGQPVITLASPWVVAGCTLAGTGTAPCATAQFVTAATRILVAGQPVLLMDSQSVCAPTGTPLFPVSVNPRTTGT